MWSVNSILTTINVKKGDLYIKENVPRGVDAVSSCDDIFVVVHDSAAAVGVRDEEANLQRADVRMLTVSRSLTVHDPWARCVTVINNGWKKKRKCVTRHGQCWVREKGNGKNLARLLWCPCADAFVQNVQRSYTRRCYISQFLVPLLNFELCWPLPTGDTQNAPSISDSSEESCRSSGTLAFPRDVMSRPPPDC